MDGVGIAGTGLGAEAWAVLAASAFVTSIVSGTLGLIGGTMLLSIMAMFFPPAVLIPFHGAVQLASNLTRTGIYFRHLDVRMLLLFSAGAVVGALSGSNFIAVLSEQQFSILLGVCILLFTWMPKPKGMPPIPGKFFLVGAGITFVSLFVGATGILMGAVFLREHMRKEAHLANQAACQALTHVAKITTYAVSGFTIGIYTPLLAVMVVMAFVGNVVGARLVDSLSEAKFRAIIKALVTVLAARMLWAALRG